jgi:hypothetical protein
MCHAPQTSVYLTYPKVQAGGNRALKVKIVAVLLTEAKTAELLLLHLDHHTQQAMTGAVDTSPHATIVILAAGTRGDVQPLFALAARLQQVSGCVGGGHA